MSIGLLRSRKVRDAIAAGSADAGSREDALPPLPYQVPSLPGG